MSAHTPGPWATEIADYGSKRIGTVFAGSRDIARIVCREAGSSATGKFEKLTAETDANAPLIDAAPALLAALKELDARLRECASQPISAAEAYDSFYQDIVSDAIAQAEVA